MHYYNNVITYSFPIIGERFLQISDIIKYKYKSNLVYELTIENPIKKERFPIHWILKHYLLHWDALLDGAIVTIVNTFLTGFRCTCVDTSNHSNQQKCFNSRK